MKVAEWVVALYELHFPWLTELRDLEEEQAFIAGADGAAEAAEEDGGQRADPVRHWLTREEFEALSTVERNQRALDRYLRSRKTPWQLGRDYERYVGYLREQDGYAVSYQGIRTRGLVQELSWRVPKTLKAGTLRFSVQARGATSSATGYAPLLLTTH
jgi:hypothetical protein